MLTYELATRTTCCCSVQPLTLRQAPQRAALKRSNQFCGGVFNTRRHSKVKLSVALAKGDISSEFVFHGDPAITRATESRAAILNICVIPNNRTLGPP